MPDPALDSHRRASLLRVFRLTGIVPLPAFLVVHAAINARALAGERAFLDAARWLEGVPLLGAFEIVFVLAPVAVHAVIGVWLVASRAPMPGPTPLPRGVRIATRTAAIVVLAFLVLHLAELRFRSGWVQPGGATLLSTLDARLSSMWRGLPLRAVAYLLGSAAACFHLGVGLWTAFAVTPRGEGARARRRAAWWCAAVGGILWILLADVVVFHATGARLFGSAEAAAPASTVPCPAPSAVPAPSASAAR